MVLGLIAALLIEVVVRRPFEISGIGVEDDARVGSSSPHAERPRPAGGRRGAARRRRAVRLHRAGAFVLAILDARRGRPCRLPVPRRRASGARRAGDDVGAAAHGADDITGDERAVALFCEQLIDIEPVRLGPGRRARGSANRRSPPVATPHHRLGEARAQARGDPPPVTFDRGGGA